jgi:hypothetical protein
MNKLIVTSSIAIVLLVPAVGMITAGNAQEGSNFDELINNTDSVSRMQQDLDNEQAFMECLETQTASECWDWVLEDCTRLLTVEECEAIENEE